MIVGMWSGTSGNSRWTYSYVHFFDGSIRKTAAWQLRYTSTCVASRGNVCVPDGASPLCAKVRDSLTSRVRALSTTSHTSNITLSSGDDRACHGMCAVRISGVGVYSDTKLPPRSLRNKVDLPVLESPRNTTLKLNLEPTRLIR